MVLDRMKLALSALARGAEATIDYKALYRAKVLRQHPNLRRLDLGPVDARWPPMSNIPLKVGVPGLEVTIPPGHMVLLGWENGDPELPYACLWDAGPSGAGTLPLKLTINAKIVELGGGPLNPDPRWPGAGRDPLPVHRGPASRSRARPAWWSWRRSAEAPCP